MALVMFAGADIKSDVISAKAGTHVVPRLVARCNLVKHRTLHRLVVDACLRGHDAELFFLGVIQIARLAVAFAMVALALGQQVTASAQAPDPALRGHGGPIRSIAVLDDKTVITGEFDAAIIVWDIPTGTAQRVFRYHDSAVNALAAFGADCFRSGGEDGKIGGACLNRAHASSRHLFSDAIAERVDAHSDPITAFAFPSGSTLRAIGSRAFYTASWDRTVKEWGPSTRDRPTPLPVLTEHRGPVSGLGIISAGVVSASYDGEVRLTRRDGRLMRQMQLPVALNGLVVLPDERIALVAADGRVRVLVPDLTSSFEVELPEGPLMAIAVASDGRTLAVAGMRTPVALIDVEKRRVVQRIHGPGLPIWALAFSIDGIELYTGGADRALRRFTVATGEPVGAPIAKPDEAAGPLSTEPGAVVFRACAICHTVRPEEGQRAGPTLQGIMGRRIASATGYDYSEALKKMDIVWTAETIAKLFEIGPTAYTPGTKMPEQRVTNPDDRRALVEWLAKVTK